MGSLTIEKKVFPSEVKAYDDKELVIEHFISTVTEDDGGDIMEPDGMVVRGKAVVLFQHGMDGNIGMEPIAKPISFTVGTNAAGKKGIIAKTQYYDGSKLTPPDNTGRRLYEKAKLGYMPNWSVGWYPIEYTPTANGGRHVTKWGLTEYSQVAVGMNSEATTDDDKTFIKSLPSVTYSNEGDEVPEVKSVIPFAAHSLAELDAPWNGAAQVAGATVDDLKIMCAWYDQVRGEAKGAYKLPHHTNDDYRTVWNGVKAAMGALLGGRGGVDMPEGDRKGVYAHLKKHYAEFEKVAPEYKEFTPFTSELKSIGEKVSEMIPMEALKMIFWATLTELYSEACEDIEKTSDQIANDVLTEAIDLMVPHMTAYVNACRARNENAEVPMIAEAYIKLFGITEQKKEPESIVDPAPVSQTVLSIKEVTPPVPEKIVFADDVRALLPVKEVVSLPCTVDDLKSLLKKQLEIIDVQGIVQKEFRKLQGKLD
jgi:hypothetical protein